MRYFLHYLVGLTLCFIFLIPAWISGVRKYSWSVHIKRIVISLLALIATLFTVKTLATPNTITTRIIGGAAVLLYLIIVYVITYKSWPKKDTI